MNVKSFFKMAAMGVGLFAFGAVSTAMVMGKLSIAGSANRAEIERVVYDYLLANPQIIVEMSNKLDQVQEQTADKQRRDALFDVGTAALLDPKIAYVTGPADAKVTVVEFFDYRCPYCKASVPTMKRVLEGNENIRIAFVERPILSPESVLAAQAAVASRRQPGKYIPFHLALMQTTGNLTREHILDIAKGVGIDVVKLEADMVDPAVLDSVKASNELANRLHFNGTPTFVINDQIVMGALTEQQLLDITRRLAG